MPGRGVHGRAITPRYTPRASAADSAASRCGGSIPGLKFVAAGELANLNRERLQVRRVLLEHGIGCPERGKVRMQDSSAGPAGACDHVAQLSESLFKFPRLAGRVVKEGRVDTLHGCGSPLFRVRARRN